jgi:hypothetical protein
MTVGPVGLLGVALATSNPGFAKTITLVDSCFPLSSYIFSLKVRKVKKYLNLN